MPQNDNEMSVNVKVDIFAFGSAIYFIMTGHEIFPELDTLEEE